MLLKMSFGSAGGLVLTIAALPQIVKTWRTQRSEDVSLAFVGLITVGRALWLAHGLAIGDASLVFWNVVGVALALLLTALVIRTRARSSPENLK